MSKVKVYSPKKKTAGNISLPKDFSEKENMYLLAQAIRVYEDNKHPRLSKTKTRSDVRASTRKIYRQKGLGLARHGAISAPIFVGGGIAHGPKGVKKKLTLPKKMKKKALSIALTIKAKDGDVLAVSDIGSVKKTKDAQNLLNTIFEKEKKNPNKVTLILSKENKDSRLYFRNLENVDIVMFEDLNAYTVFYGDLLLFDKEVFSKKGDSTKKGKSTKKKKAKKKSKKKGSK